MVDRQTTVSYCFLLFYIFKIFLNKKVENNKNHTNVEFVLNNLGMPVTCKE